MLLDAGADPNGRTGEEYGVAPADREQGAQVAGH
jgi:hypothetical protein